MHNSMQSLSGPSCYTFQFFCLLFVISPFMLSHSDPPISAPVTQRMKTLVIYVVLSASWISSELTRFL